MQECDNKIQFLRYFFIDYENVNHNGLNGISKLLQDDCVRIYYSESAETLTFGLHRRINMSKAHFDYIKVQIPIRNAVDCQILFDIHDISKLYHNAEYYIVSNDTDYDKAIDELTVRNFKVKRVKEICNIYDNKNIKMQNKAEQKQTDDGKREERIRTFFGQNFKKEEYISHKEDIIKVVLDSKTKQQVNNNLMKFYPSKTVSEIYKKLRPIIKDLPGK